MLQQHKTGITVTIRIRVHAESNISWGMSNNDLATEKNNFISLFSCEKWAQQQTYKDQQTKTCTNTQRFGIQSDRRMMKLAGFSRIQGTLNSRCETILASKGLQSGECFGSITTHLIDLTCQPIGERFHLIPTLAGCLECLSQNSSQIL